MAYSYASDIGPARRLADHIRARGLQVSIEIQSGAGGSGWLDVRHRLNMSHHVASTRSQGLTPFLSLVKNGRGGAQPVPGPLANGYMGYDRVYRVITMGRANHPGAGGPITLDGVTVLKDQGRPYIWGTEFEGGLEPWTEEMHDAMARANAGITAWLAADHGKTINANLEHKDWAPTRKIDRLNYTRAASIARIRAVMNETKEEDVVTAEDRKAIAAEVVDQIMNHAIPRQGTAEGTNTHLSWEIGYLPHNFRAVRDNADQNREKIEATLTNLQLPAIDEEKLRAGVAKAVSEALAGYKLTLTPPEDPRPGEDGAA